MFVTKKFTFHASHFLTKYHGRCERLHGHSYRLAVTIEGPIGSNDLVLDFGLISRVVRRHVLDKVDHYHLNDMFENPSAERVCAWIWQQLADFPQLLRDELNDPNIADELRAFLPLDGTLREGESMATDEVVRGVTRDLGALRLHEVCLWETDDSSVTMRG